jgi:hypothetical protein
MLPVPHVLSLILKPPLSVVLQRLQSHVIAKSGRATMVGNQLSFLHFLAILLDERQEC